MPLTSSSPLYLACSTSAANNALRQGTEVPSSTYLGLGYIQQQQTAQYVLSIRSMAVSYTHLTLPTKA